MIKKIFPLVLLLITILFFGCSEKEQQANIDIIDYDITIDFPSPGEMVVSATMSCTNQENTQQFEFLLNPAVGIHSISIKNNDAWLEVDYEREDNKVGLSIPDSLVSIEQILRFDYLFPLEQQLGNFFYIDRGFRWYPMIIDEVANVRISATVFPRYSMFSCGDLVGVTEAGTHLTYVWETQIPVFKIPVVLIPTDMYTKISTPCNDNEIAFYILKENPETDPLLLGEACAMFGYCEALIGTYPHDKLTFIESDSFEDMSFIASGLVLVSSEFMEQFRHGYTQGLHLPIAMQWFGSGVFATFQDDGFWFFSLSLPHYLRLMAVQRFEGNESFSRGLIGPYDLYQVYADDEDDMPVIDVDMLDSPAKGYAITGKGPLIFDQLRRAMGEEQWVNFLRGLYANYLGKTMTYEEFTEELSEYTEPKLMKKFNKMTHSKGEISQ